MYERSELDYLIYNAPLEYADLILNGNPETYLKTVTEYKPLDSQCPARPDHKYIGTGGISMYKEGNYDGDIKDKTSK